MYILYIYDTHVLYLLVYKTPGLETNNPELSDHESLWVSPLR